MNRKKAVGSLFALLAVCAGYYFFFYLAAIPKGQVISQENRLLTYNGTDLVEEVDGVKKWEFHAKEIQIDPATQDVQLKQVQAVFYQPDGSKVTATAETGMVDGTSRNATLQGSVQAVADNGTVLAAKSVRWLSAEHIYLASGEVRLVREDTVLTSEQLQSDATMTVYKASGRAHIQKGGVLHASE